MSTWVVVVAAGHGRRFGAPKQYAQLRGRPMVQWAVDAARSVADGVVLVLPPGDASTPQPSIAIDGADVVVHGGDSRAQSVRAGLAAVPDSAAVIVVHDGARPLASPALFGAVVGAVVAGAEGAVPGVVVADTLKAVDGDVVTATVGRDGLMAVQTPQAFRAEVLRTRPRPRRRRHRRRRAGGIARRYRAGRARRPPQHQGHHHRRPRDRPGPGGVVSPGSAGPGAWRVGQGFDIHPVSGDPGRPLVLGGVHVPGAPGLSGHSDADVLSHALADALLGAAGLGDLGLHFPSDDPAWAGAHSIDLLGRVSSMVAGAGWGVVNGDCTVVCERPRLADHTEAMAQGLSEVVRAPVSVRAKRAEGLGALGRVEGIAALAVVLLTATS